MNVATSYQDPLPAVQITRHSAPLRIGETNYGPPEKHHPLKRVSWFPTPETLLAARKGNMGHWTGKMEFAYQKRLQEIVNGDGAPKTASEWAGLNFGTKAKHIMRASDAAANAAISRHARATV